MLLYRDRILEEVRSIHSILDDTLYPLLFDHGYKSHGVYWSYLEYINHTKVDYPEIYEYHDFDSIYDSIISFGKLYLLIFRPLPYHLKLHSDGVLPIPIQISKMINDCYEKIIEFDEQTLNKLYREIYESKTTFSIQNVNNSSEGLKNGFLDVENNVPTFKKSCEVIKTTPAEIKNIKKLEKEAKIEKLRQNAREIGKSK